MAYDTVASCTITVGGAYTTATTSTITFSTASTTTPEKEPVPEPKKKADVLACLAGATGPEPMPPRRFGTCVRCVVNMAMDAFGGRCSVCGGPLRP